MGFPLDSVSAYKNGLACVHGVYRLGAGSVGIYDVLPCPWPAALEKLKAEKESAKYLLAAVFK